MPEQTPAGLIEEDPDVAAQTGEPLQAEFTEWNVWDKLTPENELEARQELARGISAFTDAEHAESRGKLNADAVKKYKEASRSLVNFRAITIDADRRPEIADAVVLTMLGTALARRAEAAGSDSYPGESYQLGGQFSGIKPQATLRALAHRNLTEAQDIFTANGNYETSVNVFDVDDPIQAMARAAVKAKLSIDTAEYDISEDKVEKESAEFLRVEGKKGLERLMIRKEKDPRFMALFGKNILEELVEPPEVINVG